MNLGAVSAWKVYASRMMIMVMLLRLVMLMIMLMMLVTMLILMMIVMLVVVLVTNWSGYSWLDADNRWGRRE